MFMDESIAPNSTLRLFCLNRYRPFGLDTFTKGLDTLEY